MSNQDVKKNLAKINTAEIKHITIRTIGMLDVFGKMIINIEYNNNSKQELVILSPVPTQIITNWLDTNKLLDKTIMYKF